MGSKVPNNISIKLEELKNKESTPENLNLLGDLYLKKGDKRNAVKYFYEAAAKISFAQKDKAIAIYKKILNISPFEINAYEKIIDIFSMTKLVAEEIKYLLLLAHVYQDRGDFKKATPIFRKINELDPTNKAVELFFSRGKVDAGGISPPEETVEIKKEIFPPEGVTKEEKYTRIPKRKRSIILIASAIALSFIVGISLYFSGKGTKGGGPTKSKGQAVSISDEGLWAVNTKTVKGDKFEIEVTRLTDKFIYKLPIASKLSQKELSENGFYLIKVKAVKDCIPEDFIKSTPRYISLINRQDNLIKPEELAGLDSIKRVIYKSNICQKESGIVFTQFYISYSKDLAPIGLSIDGLESHYPVIVKWN